MSFSLPFGIKQAALLPDSCAAPESKIVTREALRDKLAEHKQRDSESFLPMGASTRFTSATSAILRARDAKVMSSSSA